MEITKGENANLAGMEPRCPECSAKVEFVMLSDSAAGIAAMCANDHRFPLYKGLYDCHVFFRTPVLRCPCCESENVTLEQNEIARWVACHNPKCGLTHHVSTNPELAQFFRSPAPTPPLDVEAEKSITEIRERESKATKGPWEALPIENSPSRCDGIIIGIEHTHPKEQSCWDVDECPGQGKDYVVETDSGVYGPCWEDADFISHSRQDIPFLLEQISLLRRHIASPAPQPVEELWAAIEDAFAHLRPDVLWHKDIVLDVLRKRKDKLAASPAQPEKRDEWVSVDLRLPSADDPNEYVLVCWKKEWRGRKLSKVDEDTSVASPSGIDTCFIPYFLAGHFHQAEAWQPIPVRQPLPAPPQSGKEGQS